MRKPRRLIECRLKICPIAPYTSGTPLRTNPERGTGRTPEHPWTNDIKIKSEIWVQQFRNWELDGRSRLCLLAWNDDEPAIALPDKVTADLKRSEVLPPDRNKGEKRDHQAVAVTDGVSHADGCAGAGLLSSISCCPRSSSWTLVMTGPVGAWCGSRRVKARFNHP